MTRTTPMIKMVMVVSYEEPSPEPALASVSIPFRVEGLRIESQHLRVTSMKAATMHEQAQILNKHTLACQQNLETSY